MRHNPQAFPAPYGINVPNPEQLIPVLHFINTQNSSSPKEGKPSPLLQCPCTRERVFNYTNGTIDGCHPSPPFECNGWFNASRNPGCFMDKYTSGYRCCADGIFLEPSMKKYRPTLTVRAKMTFQYKAIPVQPEPWKFPSLNRVTLDVTATPVSSNVEYTVPECPKEWPVQRCQHIASNVEKPLGTWFPPTNLTHMELVQAAGHVHTGAISLQLIDHKSGVLLCDAKLRYGASEVAGDEAGYLVGIEPCVFDPPIPIYPTTELRTVASYNSTKRIDGVMSLWFLQMSTPKTSKLE